MLPPPPCTAATQVASRLFILWGIVDLVPATRASPLVLLRLPLGASASASGGSALQLSLVTLLTAWCCSEVIRYSFFAFKVGRGCSKPGLSIDRRCQAAGVGAAASQPGFVDPASQSACGRVLLGCRTSSCVSSELRCPSPPGAGARHAAVRAALAALHRFHREWCRRKGLFAASWQWQAVLPYPARGAGS